MLVQLDGSYSTLSPAVHGNIEYKYTMQYNITYLATCNITYYSAITLHIIILWKYIQFHTFYVVFNP